MYCYISMGICSHKFGASEKEFRKGKLKRSIYSISLQYAPVPQNKFLNGAEIFGHYFMRHGIFEIENVFFWS